MSRTWRSSTFVWFLLSVLVRIRVLCLEDKPSPEEQELIQLHGWCQPFPTAKLVQWSAFLCVFALQTLPCALPQGINAGSTARSSSQSRNPSSSVWNWAAQQGELVQLIAANAREGNIWAVPMQLMDLPALV